MKLANNCRSISRYAVQCAVAMLCDIWRNRLGTVTPHAHRGSICQWYILEFWLFWYSYDKLFSFNNF